MKFTTITVAGLDLPSGKADHIAWDDDLPGFGLRLRRGKDGPRRSWVCQYRASGRSRRHCWPFERLSLPQAREAAKQILARVVLGADPQGEDAIARAQSTRSFRSIVESYLAARQSDWRPETRRINKLYLTGPYFKTLHPLGLDQIDRAAVAACLAAIGRKHGNSPAAAARRSLNAFLGWAVAEGLLAVNPCLGTRKPEAAKSRERVLTDSELTAVWRAVGDDDFGRIVRLLVLLGGRRQEVGGMRWSEFDFGAGTWGLPAERAKNRHALTLALPAAALEIVRSAPRRDGRDLVFGIFGRQGFTCWSEGKAALDRRLGGKVAAFVLHDLRRTTATGMADIGIAPHIIEAVLNHRSGHRAGVAGVYNRSSYTRATEAALARWADHVLALVEGREAGDNVVALKG